MKDELEDVINKFKNTSGDIGQPYIKDLIIAIRAHLKRKIEALEVSEGAYFLITDVLEVLGI